MKLTKELLINLFEYKDGLLYWKNSRAYNKVKAGSIAGYILEGQSGMRRKIKINNRAYFASRLIFLMHAGYMPEFVDHKDRNTLNDKIENLRPATRSKNNRNRTSAKGSSSQYLGVYFFKNTGKWLANIRSNKKLKHLGLFKNEIDAAMAYDKAARELHGDFASLNFKDSF